MTKRVVHLNDMPGFQWVSTGNNDQGLGKVCINHESFWIRDCVEESENMWVGYIDNQPLECGLNFGDRVSFRIEI